MKIKIGRHGWRQVGGDVNPGAHGGTIAKADGTSIEIREIQPTREYIGDDEAADLGFPFWTKDAYFTIDDLDVSKAEVQQAIQAVGLTEDALAGLTPENHAMALAEALLAYGHGADEGPAGWAKDVVPDRVLWWGSKGPTGWRYLKDEDADFRAMMKEREQD